MKDLFKDDVFATLLPILYLSKRSTVPRFLIRNPIMKFSTKLLFIFIFLSLFFSTLVFAESISDSDLYFNWLEKEHPTLFSPANDVSKIQNDWYYRYYPDTQTYMGVNDKGDLYVLGEKFGGLKRIDKLQTLVEQIAQTTFQDTKPNPAYANWKWYTLRVVSTSMLLSKDGQFLWVGTEGGLEQYSTKSRTLINILTPSDGLPHYHITALEHDGQGGLWIGTEGGLAHRSAQGQVTKYSKQNSGLLHNHITSLARDSDTQILPFDFFKLGLWVGTTQGLFYFSSNGDWTDLQVNQQILDITSDDEKGLWVAVAWDGEDVGKLMHISNTGVKTSYELEPFAGAPASFGYFHDIIDTDKRGGLWVNTNQYLAFLDSSKQWTLYTSENYDSIISRDRIISDEQGGLWIMTLFGLSYLEQNGNLTEIDRGSLVDLTQMRAMTLDDHGEIWIKSPSMLLQRTVSGEIITNRDFFKYLFPDDISNIVDKNTDGTLWSWRESSRTQSSRTLSYHSARGERKDYAVDISKIPGKVIALKSDANGGVWFSWIKRTFFFFYSNSYGLSYRNAEGEWFVYEAPFIPEIESASSANKVFGLVVDKNKGVWFASNHWIANLRANKKWLVYKTTDLDLPDTSSFDIGSIPDTSRFNDFVFDGQEKLWVSTDEGLLYRNDQNEWQSYTPDNSPLISTQVGDLWYDQINNKLWLINSNRLFSLALNGQWRLYSTDNSKLPHNSVSQLLPDDHNGLWIATMGGLAYLEATLDPLRKWLTFTKDNSDIPFNAIKTISKDGQGGFWLKHAAMDGSEYSETKAHLSFTPESGPKAPNLVLDIYPDPKASKTVYRNGDNIKVSIDKELQLFHYFALALPDGSLYITDKKEAGLAPFQGKLSKWQGNNEVMEIFVSPELPRGVYTLYLLSMHTDANPLLHRDQWMLKYSHFYIE